LTVIALASLSYYKRRYKNLDLFPGALCLSQLCLCPCYYID
jgi:hypothetical protein